MCINHNNGVVVTSEAARFTTWVNKKSGKFVVEVESSSSGMRVMNHNWSATKQCLHPQSVAEISRHLILPGDRIRQRETSSGSCHKDTD